MGNQKSTYKVSVSENTDKGKSKHSFIKLRYSRTNKQSKERKSNIFPQLFKSRSLILPNNPRRRSESHTQSLMTTSVYHESTSLKKDLLNETNDSHYDKLDENDNQIPNENAKSTQSSTPDESNKKTSVIYPKMSERSLDSDDLMLDTDDINLELTDELPNDGIFDESDVDNQEDLANQTFSIDDRDAELCSDNDNPPCDQTYINEDELSKQSSDVKSNDTVDIEKSEINDTFPYSNSKEDKVGLPLLTRRPHSLSTPNNHTISPETSCRKSLVSQTAGGCCCCRSLYPDQQQQQHHHYDASQLSSMEMAWTWMLSSESANISQDVVGLKLLLIKLRKLLMDENGVLSEPCSPNIADDSKLINNFNDSQSTCHQADMETPNKRNASPDSSRDEILSELNNVQKKNQLLEMQLKEKDRIIALLKDHKYYRKSYQRLQSVSIIPRINRSSTFDETYLPRQFNKHESFTSMVPS